jgi:hypothetical protein
MGRKQDIPPEIEQELVYHILLMESRGFGLSIDEVETLAYRSATKKGLKVRFSEEKGKTGKTWFYGFKKRHPEISVRRPETLSLARARGMNKNDVNAISLSRNIDFCKRVAVLEGLTLHVRFKG